MLGSDFLFLQELWLYKNNLSKLLSLGCSTDMIATSTMDESVHRVGRPFGGCAIEWRDSIGGKIANIETKNNRICGVLYTYDCSTTLMINCYMPCDNYTVHVDENYVDTLKYDLTVIVIL